MRIFKTLEDRLIAWTDARIVRAVCEAYRQSGTYTISACRTGGWTSLRIIDAGIEAGIALGSYFVQSEAEELLVALHAGTWDHGEFKLSHDYTIVSHGAISCV